MENKFSVLAVKTSEGKFSDGREYKLQLLTLGNVQGDTVKYRYYGKHQFKTGEPVPFSIGMGYDKTTHDNILRVALEMPEDVR